MQVDGEVFIKWEDSQSILSCDSLFALHIKSSKNNTVKAKLAKTKLFLLKSLDICFSIFLSSIQKLDYISKYDHYKMQMKEINDKAVQFIQDILVTVNKKIDLHEIYCLKANCNGD